MSEQLRQIPQPQPKPQVPPPEVVRPQVVRPQVVRSPARPVARPLAPQRAPAPRPTSLVEEARRQQARTQQASTQAKPRSWIGTLESDLGKAAGVVERPIQAVENYLGSHGSYPSVGAGKVTYHGTNINGRPQAYINGVPVTVTNVPVSAVPTPTDIAASALTVIPGVHRYVPPPPTLPTLPTLPSTALTKPPTSGTYSVVTVGTNTYYFTNAQDAQTYVKQLQNYNAELAVYQKQANTYNSRITRIQNSLVPGEFLGLGVMTVATLGVGDLLEGTAIGDALMSSRVVRFLTAPTPVGFATRLGLGYSLGAGSAYAQGQRGIGVFETGAVGAGLLTGGDFVAALRDIDLSGIRTAVIRPFLPTSNITDVSVEQLDSMIEQLKSGLGKFASDTSGMSTMIRRVRTRQVLEELQQLQEPVVDFQHIFDLDIAEPRNILPDVTKIRLSTDVAKTALPQTKVKTAQELQQEYGTSLDLATLLGLNLAQTQSLSQAQALQLKQVQSEVQTQVLREDYLTKELLREEPVREEPEFEENNLTDILLGKKRIIKATKRGVTQKKTTVARPSSIERVFTMGATDLVNILVKEQPYKKGKSIYDVVGLTTSQKVKGRPKGDQFLRVLGGGRKLVKTKSKKKGTKSQSFYSGLTK